MKKEELKKVLKPLVQECVHEVLVKEGLLTEVVSQVVRGMTGVLVENEERVVAPPPPKPTKKKINEARRKMLNAVGKSSYGGVDLFEGTAPLASAGTPGEGPTPSSAVSGIDPKDAGVDISGLFGAMGAVWNKLK